SQIFEGLIEDNKTFGSTLLGGLDSDSGVVKGQEGEEEVMEFDDLACVLLSDEGYQKMCFEEGVGGGSPF
ncbi:hypothetical protein HK097_006085, partial [Rhizophlyctis rosea]